MLILLSVMSALACDVVVFGPDSPTDRDDVVRAAGTRLDRATAVAVAATGPIVRPPGGVALLDLQTRTGTPILAHELGTTLWMRGDERVTLASVTGPGRLVLFECGASAEDTFVVAYERGIEADRWAAPPHIRRFAGQPGCDPGYVVVDGACVNVDECAEGVHDCDASATCVDTDGGFTCDCPVGSRDEEGVCVNVDECAEGLDDCDPVALCTDTAPLWTCDCPAGTVGDGTVCDDVDECAEGLDDCVAPEQCANAFGGYDCACPDGFSDASGTCEDVDECVLGLDDCPPNSSCANLTGGFTCDCDVGFVAGDGGCVPACGDGLTMGDERCDDANDDTGDGCDDCVVEDGWACDTEVAPSVCEPTCGDGVVDAVEQCDDGAANSDVLPDACRTDCTLPRCGDGVSDSGEDCATCPDDCALDTADTADTGPGPVPTPDKCGCRATGSPAGLVALPLLLIVARRRRRYRRRFRVKAPDKRGSTEYPA